ncbi:calcium-binding protein [Microvirga aerilata]|uniref:calcium-binding protein n=1 Tax=Microvirga aerilata TaxID=670292 RepID=UPI00363C9130
MAVNKDGSLLQVWSVWDPALNADVIMGQLLAFDGEVIRGPYVISSGWANAQDPSVAALEDGRFVVTYTTSDGSGTGIQGQILAANGHYNPLTSFSVNDLKSGNQTGSEVIARPGGGFSVFWDGYGSTSDRIDIKGRDFGSDGSASLPEYRVNTQTGSSEGNSTATYLTNGRMVIAWSSSSTRAEGRSTITSSSAYLEGGNTEYTIAELPINPRSVDVVALANGRFLVMWEDAGGVFGRIYDSNNPTQPVSGITKYSDNSTASSPAVVSLGYKEFGEDTYVLVWTEKSASGQNVIMGRKLHDGRRSYGEFDAFVISVFPEGSQIDPKVASLGDGRFTVTWTTDFGPGGGSGIRSKTYDLRTTSETDLWGWDGENRHVGGVGHDHIWGNGGNDTLSGHKGNDFVDGGTGDDILSGGEGNDTLNGARGNDILRGGDGNDYVSYVDASAGVIVNLNDRSKNSGEAFGDSIVESRESLAPATVTP